MSGTAGPARSATYLRDRLDAVVDCTLWCLGCDVRHPDGNLLVAAGFSRHAPPAGRTAATMYRREDPSTDRVLTVWGFALLYTDAEMVPACVAGPALSLRRHAGLGPRLSCTPLRTACWTTEDFPRDLTPVTPDARLRAAHLLRGLADEVAAYERWIASHAGRAYRPACDADRPRHIRRRQRLPSARLAEAWDSLATSYAALLTTDVEPLAGQTHCAPPTLRLLTD